MPLQGMVRLAEAIERTRLSPATLRRRCQAGEVDGAVKDGKTWYIPEGAVESIRRRSPGRPMSQPPAGGA